MKKWQKEHEDFLLSYKYTKNIRGLFIAFRLFFPDFDTTWYGFQGKRYILGCKSLFVEGHSKNKKKVGDETMKKGFWRVKVKEPNVWKQKQKYIWEKHYGINIPKDWNVLFLDGNHENFDINNLYPFPHKLMTFFLGHTSGIIKGNSQATLLNIQISRTIQALFDFGRRMNMLGSTGSFKYIVNERARKNKAKRLKAMSDSEIVEAKKKNSEMVKKARERLKLERPEEFLRRCEKAKEYKKSWRKRKNLLKKEK